MFIITKILFFFLLIIVSQKVESLVAQKSDILPTDKFIAKIVNDLFYSLNLREIKTKPRLIQYTTVYNYLLKTTLQDHKSLKQIEKLAGVDIKNNDTLNFIAILDEILNEDKKNVDNVEQEIGDEVVIKYIDGFFSNLETLKEINEAKVSVDINKNILEHLTERTNVVPYNVTDYENYDNFNSSENDDVLFSNEYWEPSGRRIYQGTRTKIKHFPFMASVEIFNKFTCGGSIIQSDLVITAASCLQLAWNNRFYRENPAFLSVRVGSTFYEGGGENIPVLEVYFHPSYSPKNLWNNLSIMRLVRKLKFRRRKRRVRKIALDKKPWALPMTTDGITVLGWGPRSMSNILRAPFRNRLAYAVLDVYPLEDCKEIYSRQYVTTKNFCAGFISKGGGACNRDVGGPGVVNGILTGIISFGSPECGSPDSPTVFTKLGYYKDWIEEIMEQDVPAIKKRTTLKTPFTLKLPSTPFKYKSTTFKIQPFDGDTLKPIPVIDPVENHKTLRESALLNNDMFKEFLATMFDSKEVEEYKDLLEVKPYKKNVISQDFQPNEEENSDQIRKVTEIADFDEDSKQMASKDKLVTALYQNFDSSDDKKIGNDIVDLTDTIDLKDIVDEMKSLEDKENEDLELKAVKDDTKVSALKTGKINDNVLTLLYFSDIEKKGLSENSGDENNGMRIPVGSFKDLTYRSNDSDLFFGSLPRSELYKLLSEAIDSESDNTTKNII